jgi:hypothetical protein
LIGAPVIAIRMLALRVVDLVRYRQAIRMLALRVVDLVRYRQAIRMLALRVVDLVRYRQRLKIGICCFSAEHSIKK